MVALMEIIPRERWSDINRYPIRHGQIVCIHNHPRCDRWGYLLVASII